MYNFSIKINSIDEIGSSQTLGIQNLEADLAVEKFTPNEIEDLRCLLIDSMTKIVLLSTDISPDDHEELRKLFLNAHLLNVKNIKLEKTEGDLDYVFKLSKAMSIPLLFENKSGTALADESALTEIIKPCDTAGIIFNPSEFVLEKLHPFLTAYTKSHSKNRIKFLRINDALYDGESVDQGIGNAEIKELASILLARSFDGYFSIENGDRIELSYIKWALKNI